MTSDTTVLSDVSTISTPNWATSALTGRYLNDLSADRAEIPGPVSVYLERIVRARITDLLQEVAQQNSIFCGKLIPSGSFYEGTKVTSPNEFDFMFELTSPKPEHIIPKHVIPPIIRPTEEEVPHKGYFILECIPPSFQECKNGTLLSDSMELLDPDIIHRAFFDSLEDAVKTDSDTSMLALVKMNRNGPAVSMWFALNKSIFKQSFYIYEKHLMKKEKPAQKTLTETKKENIFIVKVDLVLAVPVLFSNLKLDEAYIETTFNDDAVETLSMVPSGNYWKLSVAKQESHLIRSLMGVNIHPWETSINGIAQIDSHEQSATRNLNETSSGEEESTVISRTAIEMGELCVEVENHRNQPHDRTKAQMCRRNCFIALKYLRDTNETDILERALLPTYPLKVAFLKECREHPSDEDWTEDQLGNRVYNMLDNIDKQSRDGSLTGCLLPNVPVLKTSNALNSYQARVIQYDLQKVSCYYKTCCVLSVLACIVGIVFVGFMLFNIFDKVLFLCCSPAGKMYLNETGQECAYFGKVCLKFHVATIPEIKASIVCAMIVAWMRVAWYLVVLLLRIVVLKCQIQRHCQMVCAPLSFQFIPALASIVIVILRFVHIKGNEVDAVLILASFELIYLFYESGCLISIFILRKRNQPIGDCSGPFQICAIPYFNPSVKPYYEYMQLTQT